MSFTHEPILPVEQALDCQWADSVFDYDAFDASDVASVHVSDATPRSFLRFGAPDPTPAPAMHAERSAESVFDDDASSGSISWSLADMFDTPPATPMDGSLCIMPSQLIWNQDIAPVPAVDHMQPELVVDAESALPPVEFHASRSFATECSESAYESDVEMDSGGDKEDACDDAKDADFEPAPPKERVTRPLPKRAAPKSASPSSATASRRAGAPPAPTASRSSSTSSTRAVPRARTARTPSVPAPVSKKRKATRKAGPRSSKKAAVATPRSSTRLPVPSHYYYLLKRGSTALSPRGMLCNVGGCPQRTGNFADMSRHHLTHFRGDLPTCDGCAGQFARRDSLKRHHKGLKKKRTEGKLPEDHFSPARQAFVHVFKARPEVIAKRAHLLELEGGHTKLSTWLYVFFLFFPQFAHYESTLSLVPDFCARWKLEFGTPLTISSANRRPQLI
ncbi:hypothetical protein FB451DRAFT_1166709 [Mycena latifolia]|nr:hypothetical protein FB451DRAFT_1166709 [Mycena latifolia]